MSSGWVSTRRLTPRRTASSNTSQVSLTCRWPLASTMSLLATMSSTSLTSSRTDLSPFSTGIPVAGRIFSVDAG